MSPAYSDPLYSIFEQHLFNAMVEEESTDEFLERVVNDYLDRLTERGTVIPREHRPAIESDLREEVLEMLRKKIYGHFSINEFRKASGIAPCSAAPSSRKARRQRTT